MNSQASTVQKGHSDVTTAGVRVRVAAQYVPERSDPSGGEYVFVYRVVVTNDSDQPLRLLSRYWLILDAANERREVRGDGVVGQQPLLAPGESFQYMSGCPLSTSWGSMEGSYRMQRLDGSEFDVRIGRFFLAPSVPPISSMALDDLADARR